jgi:hypothetical protein
MYIIPNILLQLPSFIKDKLELIILDSNYLNILFSYAFYNNKLAELVIVSIAISKKFKHKIIKGYPADN